MCHTSVNTMQYINRMTKQEFSNTYNVSFLDKNFKSIYRRWMLFFSSPFPKSKMDLDSIDFDALVQNLEVCIVFMFLNCSLQNVLSWINWIANERFMQFWVDCCRCCLKLLTCILTWPDYKKTIGILVVVETFLIRVKTYLIKAALNLQ